MAIEEYTFNYEVSYSGSDVLFRAIIDGCPMLEMLEETRSELSKCRLWNHTKRKIRYDSAAYERIDVIVEDDYFDDECSLEEVEDYDEDWDDDEEEDDDQEWMFELVDAPPGFFDGSCEYEAMPMEEFLRVVSECDSICIEIYGEDFENSDIGISLSRESLEDELIVDYLLTSVETWDSLIDTLCKYKVITKGQAKRLHL